MRDSCNPSIDEGSDWRHPLFGCLKSGGLCVFTFFCPCVQLGWSARAVGEPCCLCGLLATLGFAGCYAHYRIRGKLRAKYEITGNWKWDLIHTYFCGFCALVQEAREITDGAEENKIERDKKKGTVVAEAVNTGEHIVETDLTRD